MQQYHIEGATAADRALVSAIFTSAAARFGLFDTFLASRLKHTICNYSEGLGWGFGLGAVRVDKLICVSLNPAQAPLRDCLPVFEYIVTELTQTFGGRLSLVTTEKEINLSELPTKPTTEVMRAFNRSFLKRDFKDEKPG